MDAALTLHEFRILLIHSILLQNRHRIESYRLQPDMITDHVEPRPMDLWAWGIVNRSGHLRQTDPNIVRANLLPSAKATVTYRGIKYRGLFHACERATREGWFVRARSVGSWQVDVAFDPRTVDTFLVRVPTGRGLESCCLTEAYQRFAGKPWEEIDDLGLLQTEARDQSKTADLQSRVDHQAHVDAVVGEAVKEADSANLGLTKAARQRGVRENRKAERLKDWAQAVATPPEPGSKGGNGNGSERPATESKLQSDYVPPPSPLEMLRKQRESKWRNDE